MLRENGVIHTSCELLSKQGTDLERPVNFSFEGKPHIGLEGQCSNNCAFCPSPERRAAIKNGHTLREGTHGVVVYTNLIIEPVIP